MNRIRLEFAKIWNVVQQHLVKVGCHSDMDVASFAIDSLRQLTMKYFERTELTHYQTQSELLKCFDTIIRKTGSDVIKEMIIQSMQHIISLQVDNIRSGWRGIFTVLSRTAQSNTSISILEKAFNLMQEVYHNYSDKIISSGSFVSLVTNLKEFLLIDQSNPVGERIIINTFSLLQDIVNQISAANAIKVTKGGYGSKNASLVELKGKSFIFNSEVFEKKKEDREEKKEKIDSNNNDNSHKNSNGNSNKNSNKNSNGNSNDNCNDNNNKNSNDNNNKNSNEISNDNSNGKDDDNGNSDGDDNKISEKEELEKKNKTIKALLQISTEDQYYLVWFPILATYSQILIRSNNSNVKNRAMNNLFDTLENLASTLLDSKFWKNIQRSVIFPIFEDIMEHDENDPANNDFDSELMMMPSIENFNNSKIPSLKISNGEKSHSSSSSALWTKAFLRLLDLFKHHITDFNGYSYLISGFLDLIVSLVQKPRDELQNMAVTFLQQFLEENVEKIRGNDAWEIVTSTVEKCFQFTAPDVEAFRKKSNGGHGNREAQKKTIEQLTAKFIVHLRLLQEIHKFCNILVHHRLDEENDNDDNDDDDSSFVDEKFKNYIFNHLNKPVYSKVPVISISPIKFQNRWFNIFYNSYQSSHTLNETKILQQSSYHQQGITEQIPLLIEVISFSSYLQLLFSVYSVYGDGRANSKEIIDDKLIPMCMAILKSFVRSELESKYQNKILTIVIMIYKELMKINGWQHPPNSNRRLTLKDHQEEENESFVYVISNENLPSNEKKVSNIGDRDGNGNENEILSGNAQTSAIPEGPTTSSTTTNVHTIDNNGDVEIDTPELWNGIRKEIPSFFKYSIPIVQIISSSKNISNNTNYASQLADLSHTIKEFYEIVAYNFM
jgi:hypothetical protein